MTEIIISAKNVDAAVLLGAEKLGKDISEVKYEVIEEGKKGLFGIGAADAKVRVYTEDAEEASEAISEETEDDGEFVVMEGEKFASRDGDDTTPEGAALKLLNTIISDMGIDAKAEIKGWDKVKLSVGTEVELSHNFVKKGFCVNPTIAAKWTF